MAFFCIALNALNWPVRTADEEKAEAADKIKTFIKVFADDKELVSEAEAILKADEADTDKYEWYKRHVKYCSDMLKQYPVSPENDEKRLYILHILDHVLHVTGARTEPEIWQKWLPVVSDYALDALKRVVTEVENTKVPEGKLAVWKIYNMAFIVKSANKTVGFDITTMADWDKTKSPEVAVEFAKLAKLLDMAFISHLHGDHTNMNFIREMNNANKIVLIADELKWKPKDFPETPMLRKFYGEYKQAADFDGIKVRSLPGTQAPLLNSLYVVTLDGLNVMHCGDNTNLNILDLMPELGRIDVMLGTAWSLTPAMGQSIAINNLGSDDDAKRVQLYITGHENELGHRSPNRESYWETYRHFKNREKLIPTTVFAYGENVCYPSGLSIEKGGLEDGVPMAKSIPLPKYPWGRQDISPVTIPLVGDVVNAAEFVLTGESGEKVENAPIVRLSADTERKTLTISAVIPDTEIITKATDRDSAVYDDDAIEIFIGAEETPDFYQIDINSKNVVYDAKNNNIAWNAVIKSETAPLADGKGWTFKAELPLDQFKVKGDMTINICILDKPTGKVFNLIPTGGEFQDPGTFTRMNFVKPSK